MPMRVMHRSAKSCIAARTGNIPMRFGALPLYSAAVACCGFVQQPTEAPAGVSAESMLAGMARWKSRL
jgi:hypothetical protein